MSLSTGPNYGGPSDPFDLASQQSGDVIRAFNAAFQAFQNADFAEISRDIVEMEAEEKFTDSLRQYVRLFGIEHLEDPDIEDADREQRELFEEISSLESEVGLDPLFDIIIQNAEKIQEQALEEVINRHPKSTEFAILAYFVKRLVRAGKDVRDARLQELDDDLQYKLTSRFICMQSWLSLMALGEMDEFEKEFIRDIARCRYYGRILHPDRSAGEDPSSLDYEDVEFDAKARSAALAYVELDISIGRAAELIGVPTTRFEEILKELNISPRYGPESAEEMSEDSPNLFDD